MEWFSRIFSRRNNNDNVPVDPPAPELVARPRKPSRMTRVKSQLTKHFMEEHFKAILNESHAEADSQHKIMETLGKSNLSHEQRKSLEIRLASKSSQLRRIRRRTLRNDQFERIEMIGRGEFGDVYLVRDKEDGQLYAMKILNKGELVAKGQILNTITEREMMVKEDSEWNVKLFYSFQDNANLYFVMEYLPGGDLMNVLIKKGYLSEIETRFFISEIVLALNEVHKAGFIHRDVKPDNILLTRQGHIRLTDYGLSTRVNRNDTLTELIEEVSEILTHPELDLDDDESPKKLESRRGCVRSTVGTPDYIAPEVLLNQHYSELVDFWSVGVIMFEMLFGRPPFLANSSRQTAINIIHWNETLYFEDGMCSSEAIDLMKHLLCEAKDRLTFEEIILHPFFNGIDFNEVVKSTSPYIPTVSSDLDTQNFDTFEPRKEIPETMGPDVISLAFSGFRYNRKASFNSNIPNIIEEIAKEQISPNVQ